MSAPSIITPLATIDDLRRYLDDPEACAQLFMRWRWPTGFVCRSCGSSEATRLRTRRLVWQCLRCRRQTSLTAGTVLHASHVPLRSWLYAIWMVGHRKQSISALQLQKELGIGSYETAWSLLHKVREILVDDDNRPLSTPVSLGIAMLFPPRYRDDGSCPVDAPTAVMLAVEREGSGIARARVDGRVRDLQVLADEVAGHRVSLPKQIPPDFSTTPICSVILQNFRSWIDGTFHGVSRTYVEAYLSEYMFRFNHRHDEKTLACVVGERMMRQPRRAARPSVFSQRRAEQATRRRHALRASGGSDLPRRRASG